MKHFIAECNYVKVEIKESRAENKCKEVLPLKSYVPVMDRDMNEEEDLRRQISSIERILGNAASTRTLQEVRNDLSQLDKDMYVFLSHRCALTSITDRETFRTQ